MKMVLNVGIGGRSFVIDEDAYQRLNRYLDSFRKKTDMGFQAKDVMDDLEERIAELFLEGLSGRAEVVNLILVNRIISQLGMPDGAIFEETSSYGDSRQINYEQAATVKKLFRDSDNKTIGGVCSGLAYYFGIDVLIVRIVFLVALFVGTLGFWSYIIFWIVSPLAVTATQKCQMRGLPVTMENLRMFSGKF